MKDRLRFILNRIGERLWVKPLVVCVLSIAGVLLARMADGTGLSDMVPEIQAESIQTLLQVMATSMLVIATLAVTSMVSAYASASNTATPRTFPLLVADDVSQFALSTFIGAFIFSIVGLIAVTSGYYEQAGRFTMFVLTLAVLATVIVTFVRWVDRIARLGRLGAIVDKVERATAKAIRRRRVAPMLRGVRVRRRERDGQAVYHSSIGYVERVDVTALQKYAVKAQVKIEVAALPGTFAVPRRPIAYVYPDSGQLPEFDQDRIIREFMVGDSRTFDDDPRFGLVVLSEIAVRAMSPAVNDPGTAIDVINSCVRLFALWNEPCPDNEIAMECDRVEVPEIALSDMFDDAFTAIAREGAATLAVAIRLQKALASIADMGGEATRELANRHARLALARAEQQLAFSADVEVLQAEAAVADNETKPF